jgi:hypothetical protein
MHVSVPTGIEGTTLLCHLVCADRARRVQLLGMTDEWLL